MTREILFVTGNKGKLVSIDKYLKRVGWVAVQSDIKIIEPQADSLAEVSVEKARQAYSQLKRALVVNDSGFSIDAFNGFPGPYTKYVMDTIGAEGIFNMMSGVENRGCGFIQALTYVDDDGNMTTFTEEDERGVIALDIDPNQHPDDWSNGLWQIYMPNGYQTTLNHVINKDDVAFHARKKDSSVFGQLANWLEAHAGDGIMKS